jgi:hypothetical protein
MTWGSVAHYSDGNTCLRCRYINRCRERVRVSAASLPVLCEEEAKPSYPDLICDSFQPGEILTSRQVSERIGLSQPYTSKLCAIQWHAGLLEDAGWTVCEKGGRARLYRYAGQNEC